MKVTMLITVGAAGDSLGAGEALTGEGVADADGVITGDGDGDAGGHAGPAVHTPTPFTTPPPPAPTPDAALAVAGPAPSDSRACSSRVPGDTGGEPAAKHSGTAASATAAGVSAELHRRSSSTWAHQPHTRHTGHGYLHQAHTRHTPGTH